MTIRWFPSALMMATVVVAAGLQSPAADDPASDRTLEAALKEIDRTMKGVRGLTAAAEVTLADGQGETVNPGRIYVIPKQRMMRLEVSGDVPRTIIRRPEDLHVHWPGQRMAVEYDLREHPEQLAQYATVGFNPAGTEMENEYMVSLIGQVDLEGRQTLRLELTPRNATRRTKVSKIQLWVDQATWLPLQQRIHELGADTHLTVRYHDIVREDSLDGELFKAKWPKGTEKVKG